MLKRLTALLIVFTITSYSFAAGINSLFGTFDRVIDGDTLVFKTASAKTLRIRLADIDTPELDQPWGEESQSGPLRVGTRRARENSYSRCGQIRQTSSNSLD